MWFHNSIIPIDPIIHILVSHITNNTFVTGEGKEVSREIEEIIRRFHPSNLYYIILTVQICCCKRFSVRNSVVCRVSESYFHHLLQKDNW